MVTAGIAVLTGAILACFQTQSMDIYWLSLLPVSLFFSWFHRPGRLFWLLLSSFLYTSLHVYLHLQHRPSDEIARNTLSVSGKVASIPVYRGTSARFIYQVNSTQSASGLPQRIRLSWKNPPQVLHAGQVWRLEIRLKPAHGFQNPGGFDYERWLFVKGIQATGYVVNGSEAQLLDQNPLAIDYLRERVNAWIQSHCVDCRYAGLLQALSTGYRGNIGDQERELLRNSGTAHLIAISGLHIGVIAAFVFFLAHHAWNLFFCRTPFKRSEFCWLLSWLVVFIYCLLSGFELPAQRAFIMFSILGLLNLLRVPTNLLSSVMTTLVVVLAFSPLSVLSESFWLTLCALAIILLGSFMMQNQHARWRQLLQVQWLFSLLFIPLTLIIFHQIHSASLLANLIAVPLVSLVIVPVNFVLLIFFFLPDSWLDMAYALMDRLVALLIDYLQLLQQLGLQAIQLHSVSVWQLMLVLLLLLMIVLPAGILRMRSWLLLLPAIILWPGKQSGDVLLKLAVLDVGTGNAVIIQTRHHSLVYDFGPGNRRGYSTGAWVVAPFLQHQGIHQVDQLIISHNDQDHAGGLYAIIGAFQQRPVASGTPASLRRSFPELSGVRDCHDMPPWRWDGVQFEFLTTRQDGSSSENNRSCVLRISLAGHHLLLTGDIEAEQEAALVKQYSDRLKAEVLLAPHHGSETSSSQAFVQAVAAQHVVFSAGYLNHWKFPRQAVIERYQATAARLYRTDHDGAIQVYCNLGACRVEKFRQRYPRIWY